MTEPTAPEIDGRIARTIITPNDAEELAGVLKSASEEKRGVVPRGGGTMLELGAPLERADTIVSLEKLNRVLDYQPANLTVQTQAGVTLGALNQTLAQHGQFLPLDPPFPDRATIGGILATNASGALRVRYGSARDLVIGMRIALTDGQIVKGGGQVVKNVAGYDLPKLFIGSLGTLGIIVEATFKVVPLPKKTATVFAAFEKLEDACAVALKISQSPLLPNGVEILNSRASNSLGLGEAYALLVRFGGVESAIKRQAGDVERWSRENNSLATTIMDERASLWAQARDFLFEHETVIKIGVLPTQIREICGQMERFAEPNGVSVEFAAHSLGIVYAALDGDAVHVAKTISESRQAVAAMRGHLTIQRGPRALREQVAVWGPTRSDYVMMQKLKQEFDPNGVLNPGRFRKRSNRQEAKDAK